MSGLCNCLLDLSDVGVADSGNSPPVPMEHRQTACMISWFHQG